MEEEFQNARVDGTEVGLKAYIDQRCERVETTLLTEFHKWAGPVGYARQESFRRASRHRH